MPVFIETGDHIYQDKFVLILVNKVKIYIVPHKRSWVSIYESWLTYTPLKNLEILKTLLKDLLPLSGVFSMSILWEFLYLRDLYSSITFLRYLKLQFCIWFKITTNFYGISFFVLLFLYIFEFFTLKVCFYGVSIREPYSFIEHPLCLSSVESLRPLLPEENISRARPTAIFTIKAKKLKNSSLFDPSTYPSLRMSLG